MPGIFDDFNNKSTNQSIGFFTPFKDSEELGLSLICPIIAPLIFGGLAVLNVIEMGISLVLGVGFLALSIALTPLALCSEIPRCTMMLGVKMLSYLLDSFISAVHCTLLSLYTLVASPVSLITRSLATLVNGVSECELRMQ